MEDRFNQERPHCSLGYQTPIEFAAAQAKDFAAALAAGFFTALRGSRNSNAFPCPSRSPISGSTPRWFGRKLSYSQVNESRGPVNTAEGVCSKELLLAE